MRCWNRSWPSGSSARSAPISPSASCARPGCDDQVAAAVAAIKTPDGAKLARDTAKLFKRQPDAEWRDSVETEAEKLARAKR